jgi:hypothetical protein
VADVPSSTARHPFAAGPPYRGEHDGMYEIRTRDEHAVLVGQTDTLDQALQVTEDLHDRIRDQLAANGEGATDLWLAYTITGPAGEEVAVGLHVIPSLSQLDWSDVGDSRNVVHQPQSVREPGSLGTVKWLEAVCGWRSSP